MRKLLSALALGITFSAGVSYAAPVHDWHDLDAVRKHLVESINEMQRARARNHYDMDGHGEKAEALLRQAEQELSAAVASAKHAH